MYLTENKWKALQKKNRQILEPIVSSHRHRAFHGQKNPIVDFLFDYYHFKPAKLLEWSPGIGFILLGKEADNFTITRGFQKSNNGVFVNPESFPTKRITGLDWTINLLEKTIGRKALFNCFGLHEWCMVYEKNDIRHSNLPLRLSHSEIRSVVEQHSVKCTHYDAYRFYSDTATKFNKINLTRENMPDHEQPGCLHTNMDLYRWAYKFYPWISSNLVCKTFLLALKIRETDMRASPYNLSDYSDLSSLRIESSPGKTEYIKLQSQYHEQAKPLRNKLLGELKKLRSRLN